MSCAATITTIHAQVRSKMAAFVVDIGQFDTAAAVTSTDTTYEQLTGVFVWLTKHLQYLSNTVSKTLCKMLKSSVICCIMLVCYCFKHGACLQYAHRFCDVLCYTSRCCCCIG
jgi:hypothetical protein